MIICTTFNPAIDFSLRLSAFEYDSVNRPVGESTEPAGKGIDVAINLRYLDHRDVVVSGFLGKGNEGIFSNFFKAERLEDFFIRVPGSTRTNVILLNQKDQTVTNFNNMGSMDPDGYVERLLVQLEDFAKEDKNKYFVFAGSLPRNVPKDLFIRVVDSIRYRYGRTVVADTSGDSLISMLKGKSLPNIIKPNEKELGACFDTTVETVEDVVRLVRPLLDKGVELGVVSMGAKGTVYMTKGEGYVVTPPKVDVVSTVGAGDAVVSGIVHGLASNMNLEELARFSSGLGTGAVTHDVPRIIPEPKRTYYIREQKVEKINI